MLEGERSTLKMRVSAVQYHLHTIHSLEEFAAQVEHYVKIAQEFEADFVLFPELFTTQLMSIGDDNGKALPTTRKLTAAFFKGWLSRRACI
ncbi:hypothetical protein GCM10008018_34460 [Paenibacillus marchantiophytorum]|uniref:CN hydrolase domain-containing protein n=1 Tax=Paenibacillus marchantiophytorum TaxID=1619310 RepID=A0ABQ1ETQ9_9BACL|nr:hypothetical protein GCM10008018_34460 [Paenibacillus marchantiophytorum]